MNRYWIGPFTIVVPTSVLEGYWIEVNNGIISTISEVPNDDDIPKLQVHCDGYHLYPALINAHDHLIDTYQPKFGKKNSHYISVFDWLVDVQNSPFLHEKNKITPLDLYLLGCYKNILSGVVTVLDHYPQVYRRHCFEQGNDNSYLHDNGLVRILEEYTLDYNVHPKSLAWGEGPKIEHQRAVEYNYPYITHVEEGFDEESFLGIKTLMQANALSEHTILVHAMSCSDDDLALIADRKAHIIVCPLSNFFLFGRIPRIKKMLEYGINVSIGTNSTLSGSDNILDEIRFLKTSYMEMYGDLELDDEELVKMVTINPAKALRIEDKTSSIEVGKSADLLLIRSNNNPVFSSLVNANYEDIALVLRGGKPIYGDAEFIPFFQAGNVDHVKVLMGKQVKAIIGDPYSVLRRIRKSVGYNKFFSFIPLD